MTRCLVHRRFGVLAGAATALMLAWLGSSFAIAAQPDRRLDAEQRQRLRHELNQQWHALPAGLEPGMATPAGPHPGMSPLRPLGPGRLSPEERHELRRQLRQQYRHGGPD